MGKRVAQKEYYKFKKGERYHLDDIYLIQGIGGNDWWTHDGEEYSDDIVITRNHEFTITFYKAN